MTFSHLTAPMIVNSDQSPQEASYNPVFPPKPRPMPWTGSARFPCHLRMPAMFDGVAITTEDVQFWEQECPGWMCGRRYRFKRQGMWLWINEFHGPFTEPVPKQQSSPAPKWEVLFRIATESFEESA
jgi:hypothetical protein